MNNPSNSHSVSPHHGVVTLSGYGIKACVNRGHLILEDGCGADRHTVRLPRVGHGLKRLVVISSDGFVSLAALRWLADQEAGFVLLERNGKTLCVTGPVSSSDAKLRRAQALAIGNGMARRDTCPCRFELLLCLARSGDEISHFWYRTRPWLGAGSAYGYCQP
jgi:hypothetical protein